jgi:hypothetical protein
MLRGLMPVINVRDDVCSAPLVEAFLDYSMGALTQRCHVNTRIGQKSVVLRTRRNLEQKLLIPAIYLRII